MLFAITKREGALNRGEALITQNTVINDATSDIRIDASYEPLVFPCISSSSIQSLGFDVFASQLLDEVSWLCLRAEEIIHTHNRIHAGRL